MRPRLTHRDATQQIKQDGRQHKSKIFYLALADERKLSDVFTIIYKTECDGEWWSVCVCLTNTQLITDEKHLPSPVDGHRSRDLGSPLRNPFPQL